MLDIDEALRCVRLPTSKGEADEFSALVSSYFKSISLRE